MLHPEVALIELGGVATSATLHRYGFSDLMLSRACRAGQVDRLRRGVYGSRGISPELRQANQHGGVLTCASVLRARGVWTFSPADVPHVWIGRSGHSYPHPGCRCVVHQHGGRPGVGSADLPTALAHFLACAGDEAFFAAVESALHQDLLSAADRERLRRAIPAKARWLLDLACELPESGTESVPRLRLVRAGFKVRPQPGTGRRRHQDLVVDELVLVEFDGKEFHSLPKDRHRDYWRDAESSKLGYETLHFDYAQVFYDWPQVLASITAAVERARGRR